MVEAALGQDELEAREAMRLLVRLAVRQQSRVPHWRCALSGVLGARRSEQFRRPPKI
jgi:hypothetical protein